MAVLPYLSHISEDQDVTVRNEAAQIIIDLCLTSDSQKCQDFLSIIEKVSSHLCCRPCDLKGVTEGWGGVALEDSLIWSFQP